MKKILLTWASWMLAYDFKKYIWEYFEIFSFSKQKLDISNTENLKSLFTDFKPDLILNLAAYTKVDEAEGEWKLQSYEVNTIWTYNLAKISKFFNIDFITISTDYVFDWENEKWYNEDDICNPINEYWMSKYLGEKLALEENPNSIIIRTSWLYGWWKDFKNFVNTMLKLSQIKTELKVVNDQFWLPTYTKDLSFALKEVIQKIESFRWKILQFSNSSKNAITWHDFAKKIFEIKWIKINLLPCTSKDFETKAKRPKYSKLNNSSSIKLREWEKGLGDYLSNI